MSFAFRFGYASRTSCLVAPSPSFRTIKFNRTFIRRWHAYRGPSLRLRPAHQFEWDPGEVRVQYARIRIARSVREADKREFIVAGNERREIPATVIQHVVCRVRHICADRCSYRILR